MAGHMGNKRVTLRHLEVFEADPSRNLLLVKGSIPGARNGLVLIQKSKDISTISLALGENQEK
jgi:large subunit ribosomal protein L3